MDRQEVTCLVLFDLSATFNTVNHGILLSCQETWFGITGTALQWIKYYLSDQMQSVMVGNPKVDGAKSKPVSLTFGIPQCSGLGPTLFMLYTSPLGDLYSGHGVDFPTLC